MTKITGSTAKIPAFIGYNGTIYEVTAIEPKAAKGNKSLKSVTIGSSVKSIGEGAFSKCSKLKTIKVTSTKIKTVGANAFKGISKKPTLTVPSSMKSKYKKLWKKSGFPSKGVIKTKK